MRKKIIWQVKILLKNNKQKKQDLFHVKEKKNQIFFFHFISHWKKYILKNKHFHSVSQKGKKWSWNQNNLQIFFSFSFHFTHGEKFYRGKKCERNFGEKKNVSLEIKYCNISHRKNTFPTCEYEWIRMFVDVTIHRKVWIYSEFTSHRFLITAISSSLIKTKVTNSINVIQKKIKILSWSMSY